MNKQSSEAWIAFLRSELTHVSADFMVGVDDLPVQEREWGTGSAGLVGPISAAERRTRQKAAKFARASVGLEGFVLTDADDALIRQFIDGEISLEDCLKSVLEDVRPTRP